MKHKNILITAALVLPFPVVPFAGSLFAQSSSGDLNTAVCDETIERAEITQISLTRSTVHTSILINAAQAEVWHVLTDFDNMSSWSSGKLQDMSGELEDGDNVVITFLFGVDADGKPLANKVPHTLIFEDGVQFGWSDPFPTNIGGGNAS